jgi:uncharacterized repeat protein (TIGR01451 family)
MRLSATTAVTRLAPALLAALALSALGPGAALAAKPSGGGTTSGGGSHTKSTTPPTISIASPTSGATVSSPATVTGTASDSAGVASVQVSVDSGTYQAASGTTSWSDTVSSLSAGSHTITAKATDTSGLSSTASISVSVIVSSTSNATPPSSSILEPRYDGAVVAGTYTLNGYSSDATYGIAKEQWAIDGTVVATGAYPASLPYAWDTTTAAQGAHTITYTSWNTAGASSSVSRPITVGTATIERVAVILYNFSDQAPPTTPQQVSDWTFGSNRSVAGYYKEESFGRLLLGGQYNTAGDVFGFYTIPYSFAAATSCDFSNWESSAMQQAQAAGVNFGGYDVYMLTAAVPGGCGAGVGGGIQDRVPWDAPTTADQWISFAGHELGHSFGIHHHASSWTCTDSSGHPVQISSTCTTTEYGDPYDIMSVGEVEHMNVYEKGQLGVLRPSNTLTVSTSGTYSLAPSTSLSTGVQSIRIPRAWDSAGNPTDFYYLEYRQPTPYDVPSWGVVDYDGVLIREAPDYSQTSTASHLIDTTPGSNVGGAVRDNYDAALVPGRYFQDSATGLTVETLSTSSSGATISVTLGTPTCHRVNPSVSISPSAQTGTAGSTLNYTVTVANNDSPACGASDFTVTSSLPSGFSQSPTSMSVVGLYPAGATSSWLVSVTIPSTATTGAYSFTETATDATTGATASATDGANVT